MRSHRRRSAPERAREFSTFTNTPPTTNLLRPLADVPSDDRRRWHPDGDNRPVLTRSGTIASVRVGPASWTVHKRPVVARGYFGGVMPKGFQVPIGLKFANEWSVSTCIRRKVRREIIHAKNLVFKVKRRGAGAGGKRMDWRYGLKCR